MATRLPARVKEENGVLCILPQLKCPEPSVQGYLGQRQKPLSFLNFDMCSIMYTSYIYVLSAGNNCFPVKMLQKDSLFTFQRRLKLDLGLSVLRQFCYKDHKINVSAISQFQCLTDISCSLVSIGRTKTKTKTFNSTTLKAQPSSYFIKYPRSF